MWSLGLLRDTQLIITAHRHWEKGVPVGLGIAPLWDHPGVSGSHQGQSMMCLDMPFCTKKKKIPRARKSSRKSCKSDCRADRIIWGGKIRILLLRHALLPGRCLPVPVIFCSTLMLLLKGPLKSLMTQIQPKSWNIPQRDIAVIGSVRSWWNWGTMIWEHCFPCGICSNVQFSEVTALPTSHGHTARDAMPQGHRILTKNPATLLLTPESNFCLCSSSCPCQYCSGPLCPAFTGIFSANKNRERDCGVVS